MNEAERWPYGRVLFATRRRHGFSAQALADATGMTRSVIANLESGRCDLRVGDLVRIAAALGVTPAALDPRVAPASASRIAEAQAALEAAEAALADAILGEE